MYRPLRSNKQNDYLFSRRNQGNLTMASADKIGILKIQRALNNGDLVGILPDQDPGEEGGLMSPFFGKKVNTMTLLARIAKKQNAQVLMFWAERLDDGQGYDLNIEPVDLNANGDNLLSLALKKGDKELVEEELETFEEARNAWKFYCHLLINNYGKFNPDN